MHGAPPQAIKIFHLTLSLSRNKAHFHLTDQENEAQRGLVNCPRSRRWEASQVAQEVLTREMQRACTRGGLRHEFPKSGPFQSFTAKARVSENSGDRPAPGDRPVPHWLGGLRESSSAVRAPPRGRGPRGTFHSSRTPPPPCYYGDPGAKMWRTGDCLSPPAPHSLSLLSPALQGSLPRLVSITNINL